MSLSRVTAHGKSHLVAALNLGWRICYDAQFLLMLVVLKSTTLVDVKVLVNCIV